MSDKFFVPCAVGIDEVGRGSVAGPVIACAVFFAESLTYEILSEIGINDSKKLSIKKREIINLKLMQMSDNNLMKYGLGLVEAAEIDEIGILKATNKAMRYAFESLKTKDVKVLVDGNINPFNFQVENIVKGDEKCYNIGAASIIAKVARDKIIDELAEGELTCYNWKKNKGYASSEHIYAIRQYGLSVHHRKSFCKNFL